ncbi:MAG: adenosylhomocysteinase [Bifidobacteriaceae bacterium]|nr:adenosylhomocysteinase [Bifidobacteriaceae bacterium]
MNPPGGIVLDLVHHAVRDLSLAAAGRDQIRLAEQQMPGLMALRRELGPAKPLAGARITGSLHMTVQTAVLIETLVDLGARVRWASCNIFSTQDEAAAAVVVGPAGTPQAPAGPAVFAWKGESVEEYWWCTLRALTWPDGSGGVGPDLVVDDGADATTLLLAGSQFGRLGQSAPSFQDLAGSAEGRVVQDLIRDVASGAGWAGGVGGELASGAGWAGGDAAGGAGLDPWARLIGGLRGVSEETTTGVHRLAAWAETGELPFPVINVNDSVTKSKFDNTYGIRHSLPDGLNRATDMLIGGKVAVVAGYGDVGKGAAEALRGQGARVIITEIDPICALQAAMDGYQVVKLEDVLASGDFFITATGNRDVITVAHLAMMKDKAVIANVGHFDNEIDMAGLAALPSVRRHRIKDQVDEWVFDDGHSVLILSEGRLANLGNATGHPSFVMSCSFANQVLAQIELWQAAEHYGPGLHRLPKRLDEKVARSHLAALGVELTQLTPIQAVYLGVPPEGPFKPDYYRY